MLPSFTVLGNRFFFVVPGLSLRIVGVFCLLLDATGLSAAFPSSRQGMLVTCSALGTTVPVRLLQEALVIFVFKQISQFVYFGK